MAFHFPELHLGGLFNVQSLILAGVVVHLVASTAKALVKSPKQKAQINAIEGKVDDVLTQVQAILPVTLPTSAAVPADPDATGTLALQPLPSSPSVRTDLESSAQGGAS